MAFANSFHDPAERVHNATATSVASPVGSQRCKWVSRRIPRRNLLFRTAAQKQPENCEHIRLRDDDDRPAPREPVAFLVFARDPRLSLSFYPFLRDSTESRNYYANMRE